MNTNNKQYKIAIIGCRGIPANYGGYEVFTEKLALYLANKNHKVTVYGLKSGSNGDNKFNLHNLIKLVNYSLPKQKHIEKLLLSALSTFHSCIKKNDAILLLGLSASIFSILPYIKHNNIFINVDGLEWERKKWGKLGSFFMKKSGLIAKLSGHKLIADSKSIQQIYKEQYNADLTFIPYGADIDYIKDSDITVLSKFGLKSKKYFLQISRVEPENNIHWTITECLKAKIEYPLVIIGDSYFKNQYQKKLHKIYNHNSKIIFLGGIYDDRIKVLRRNSLCYIHGHEVGGTNPSLLDAMGSGNCILALDVPFNREVLGNSGLLVKKDTGLLANAILSIIKDKLSREKYCKRAQNRVKTYYQWSNVLLQYEEILKIPKDR